MIPPAARACPECGRTFDRDDVPSERDEQLVELGTSTPHEDRRAEWDRLVDVVVRCGLDLDWAIARYRETFGAPPPRALVKKATRASATPEQRRAFYDRVRAIADRRGYRPGFAYYRFREEFGEPPPREWERGVDERRAPERREPWYL